MSVIQVYESLHPFCFSSFQGVPLEGLNQSITEYEIVRREYQYIIHCDIHHLKIL